MKRRLVATFLMLALAPCGGANPPRVATVRVNDVLLQLDSSKKANEDYKAKQEAILNDRRKITLEELQKDLLARRSSLEKGKDSMDQETVRKLVQDYMNKVQEQKSLEEDYHNFTTEKQQALNAEFVAGIRVRLNEIRDAAQKLAEADGYDWVFDSSGISNTGVPLMLYAKTPNDLTDRVLAALAAPKPAPPPAPHPAPPANNPKKPKQR